MKNIHILPTDKPSKLATHYEKMRLIQTPDMWTYEFTKQNIYITSDEEIKEGDYSFYLSFGVGKNIVIDGELCFHIEAKDGKGSFTQRTYQTLDRNKKIILTTDADLIKEGVQAIPDEFLEWFVKNPSCESVEVEIESKFDRVDGHYHDVWEIIIPKEEPKQETLVEEFDEQIEQLRERGITITHINKQETLEEAINKYPLINQRIGFKEGVKWQQEQDKKMYSEEEVKHLMTLAFEQGFKKADVVEAGLEAKETDTEVNWIFLKHKK